MFPTAALHWTAIDATRALATLTVHDVSVSLEFRFADSGEVTSVFMPARWGAFSEGYRQVPWEGHFGNYREQSGVMVPMDGEVGWYVGDAWRAVWKGQVVGFRARTLE